MKEHRDFVIYVRGGEAINALVISSRAIVTPATQTEEAFSTEHLALVYLEPGTYSPLSTGEQVRNSIKTALDVKPFVEGGTFGWKEVIICHLPIYEAQGSGSERYAQDGDPYGFKEYMDDSPHAKALEVPTGGVYQPDGGSYLQGKASVAAEIPAEDIVQTDSAIIDAAKGDEHTQETQENQ